MDARPLIGTAALLLLAASCGRSCDEAPAPAAATVASGATTAGSAASEKPSAAPATATSTNPGETTAAPTASPAPARDDRPLVASSQQQLLALLPTYEPKDEPLLRRHIDVGGPAAMNHGNDEIAHHDIARADCRAGLEDISLQTEEQRRLCGGHANMVPIYDGGDASKARTCIDIFEFPNRACELPFVWAGPAQARAVCRKLGKRLCTQGEWMLACEGDPEGGPPWRYAFGDDYDLTVCNTNKPAREHNDGPCDPHTAKSTWKSCSTNTEPAGAFPKCRSRFGVFDLHGNVAEAMTRRDPDGKTYSQLKGSAFFYVDVQRKDGGEKKRTNYPDHCRHDPRWHVQHMPRAWHVNDHLGFRCCADAARK